jgi:DhnA family fructose-bisphosphate aldolase class Ia
MRNKIVNVQGLIAYVKNNSSWSASTIGNVITALGYSPKSGWESLVEVSGNLSDCAKHGADSGFSGFTHHDETIAFFLHNRKDIVKNLERVAEELGEDIIKMVQSFGEFRYSMPPAAAEVGKAIWDTGKVYENLTSLYKVFAWFCLEEISNIWYRYLEDNPNYYAELSA